MECLLGTRMIHKLLHFKISPLYHKTYKNYKHNTIFDEKLNIIQHDAEHRLSLRMRGLGLWFLHLNCVLIEFFRYTIELLGKRFDDVCLLRKVLGKFCTCLLKNLKTRAGWAPRFYAWERGNTLNHWITMVILARKLTIMSICSACIFVVHGPLY